MKNLVLPALLFLSLNFSIAQDAHVHGGGDGSPDLHVNPRWRECSFQLDPGLTQSAWREFTKEAALVVSFRPLTDAKPMGVRRFEVALLQWSTAIDERKDAWNDTFVHPDSAHWLVGGSRLPIMGITARMGITDKLDVGVYLTKNPGANYGFMGVQAQYQLLKNETKKWSTALRGSYMRLFGPEDVGLQVYTAEIVTSKEFVLHERWLRISPYVVASGFVSASREKSEVVDLRNERVAGLQGGGGLVVKVASARIGAEYNFAAVTTLSMKIGITF